MIALVLKDERGEIWRDFVVLSTNSDRLNIMQAEEKLVRKFTDYWWSGRFPIHSDGLVAEVKRTLIKNGWSIKQFTVEDEPK